MNMEGKENQKVRVKAEEGNRLAIEESYTMIWMILWYQGVMTLMNLTQKERRKVKVAQKHIKMTPGTQMLLRMKAMERRNPPKRQSLSNERPIISPNQKQNRKDTPKILTWSLMNIQE